MGRAILKSLRESTLLTFFQVCKEFGLKPNVDYRYNSMEGVIRFWNESAIYLKDLFLYPSDPEFDTLGSTEFTGAFIDEASQITVKAKNIVMSRIRYKLDEFGLIPKLLIASNPAKNFLYFEFYKPDKDGTIEPYRAFIPALVVDNPFISKFYIENLKKLDRISKERLLYGNFEYDDDPTKLFEYDQIIDMFTNSVEKGDSFCTVDVAGRGRDRTIILIWNGLFLEKVYNMDNISSTELDKLLSKHRIPRSKCVIDEDGVGFGLVKDLIGVKGFVNNSRPITRKKETDDEKAIHNYKNLKAQCWFELANYVNSGWIGITKEIRVEERESLIEDLEQIKQKDPGRDAPLQVLSKDEIKEQLGRSTDMGDCLVGETKVLTTNGYKFIKDIKKGEQVITPYGNRMVLDIKKKKTKELMRIKFNNGQEIYCTPNHKIYLNDSFKKVKTLVLREYKGELFNIKHLLKWRIKRLFTKGKNTGFYPVEDIITKKEMEKSKLCTEEFMRIQQEDKLIKEKKYTILTETILTILQRILWQLKNQNIKDFIRCRDLKMSKRNVFYAIKNLLISPFTKKENIVQIDASKITSINKKNILKKEIVYSAEKNLKSKNKIQPNAVQEVVQLNLCGEIDVYDLKVQKDHCYYANDILVSNSMMMRMFFVVSKKEMITDFLD